ARRKGAGGAEAVLPWAQRPHGGEGKIAVDGGVSRQLQVREARRIVHGRNWAVRDGVKKDRHGEHRAKCQGGDTRRGSEECGPSQNPSRCRAKVLTEPGEHRRYLARSL